MRQELKEMYDLLQEQKAVQQKLLELSYEKNQVVIRSDVARLTEITTLEQRYVTKLKNLDRKRIGQLPAISALLGIPEGEINLSGIVEKLSDQEHHAFFLLQKELARLLQSQVEINKLNSELLETQIEYTENMLGLLIGDEDPLNNFYGDDGKADFEKRKSPGLFDRQI